MYPGMIILWYGAIADIPNQWLLCDGTNGTPDLRDKFVVGSGNSYAQDAVGGNVSHVHPFTGDGHFHEIPAFFMVEPGVQIDDKTSTDPATGTTDSKNNLPPHHALCYLMKQ